MQLEIDALKEPAAWPGAGQLAFELEGALLTASWYFRLHADPGYLSRARRAVQGRWQRSCPCWQAHPAASPADRRD